MSAAVAVAVAAPTPHPLPARPPRRHMYGSVIAAFSDNRLDAGLMRGCHQEIALHCGQHPARALECLRVRQGRAREKRREKVCGAWC